jgi:hypothetical protein
VSLFGLYVDPTYIIMMIPGFILAAWASIKVKSTFSRFSRVRSSRGMTGAQIAREILKRNNIHDVQVVETRGMLSDHYDPRKRVVRLSPDVYRTPSVSAVAVAAHEVGHALQHAKHYAPLALRSAAVPVARIGSWGPWIIIIGGFWFQMLSAVYLGVVLFLGLVAFQLITLPVEFNASTRARHQLEGLGLVSARDAAGVRKVLSAAAMTYVAAAIAAVMQLLYYLMLLSGRSDD